MADVDEQQILLAIQQALKPRTSSAPKLEHLKVAIALARDDMLVLTRTCKEAGFSSSGTRKTILGYRNRLRFRLSLTRKRATSITGDAADNLLARIIPSHCWWLTVHQSA